jgi:hypothetical protein
MINDRTKGIGAVALFTFLLFAMPRLNLRVGPIPVYAIDLTAAYIILRAYSIRRNLPYVKYPFRSLILIILSLVIVSELSVLVYDGSLLDALYVSIQFFLAFGLIFALPQAVRTAADVELILKALSIALLITCLLMIMSSLPQTRPIAIAIFSIPQLEPANTARRYAERYGDTGVRGATLIGVSILSATFICIAWPLVGYLRTQRFRLNAFWSLTAISAIVIAPMAIVMSYSRQAAVALFMILLALLVMQFGKLRSVLLRPVLLSVGFVLLVGVGSSLFFFDRYVNRFEAIFESPLSDEREAHRVLSYIAPFDHVMSNPQFLVIGAGTTTLRSDRVSVEGFEENHSLFGAGYFAHGMLSTVLFIFLLVAAYHYANVHRKRAAGLQKIARDWPRALYLAYLPMLPMAAFAPAFGKNVRAIYVYIFVLGLLSALRNTELLNSLQQPPRPVGPAHAEALGSGENPMSEIGEASGAAPARGDA